MEIFASRLKISFYILLITSFLCVIFFNFNKLELISSDKRILAYICCILLILFCSLVVLKLIQALVNPRLLLRITEEGFEHPNIGFIRWSNVTKLCILEVGHLKFINYKINNYNDVTANWSPSKKMLNSDLDKSLSISLQASSENTDKIFNLMYELWQKKINESSN